MLSFLCVRFVLLPLLAGLLESEVAVLIVVNAGTAALHLVDVLPEYRSGAGVIVSAQDLGEIGFASEIGEEC